MYKKLLPFVNHYLMIETVVNNAFTTYKGLLVDVNPEVFEIETFSDTGEPEGRWFGLTNTIASVQADGRELRELSLHVKYHSSMGDEDELIEALPEGQER